MGDLCVSAFQVSKNRRRWTLPTSLRGSNPRPVTILDAEALELGWEKKARWLPLSSGRVWHSLERPHGSTSRTCGCATRERPQTSPYSSPGLPAVSQQSYSPRHLEITLPASFLPSSQCFVFEEERSHVLVHPPVAPTAGPRTHARPPLVGQSPRQFVSQGSRSRKLEPAAGAVNPGHARLNHSLKVYSYRSF